jgi:hypothetical protein
MPLVYRDAFIYHEFTSYRSLGSKIKTTTDNSSFLLHHYRLIAKHPSLTAVVCY